MATDQNLTIPFNSIYIDEEINVRTDEPKVKDIAESIKVHGLIQPLVVVNGGPEGQEYRLLAGFRRAAALKSLKWGSKPVKVTILEKWDPLVNVIENVQRESVHPHDLAQRIYDMVQGDHPLSPDETAPGKGATDDEKDAWRKGRAYSKDVLAKAFNMSISSINTYMRVIERLSSGAKKFVKKHPEIPLRVLNAVCTYGGDDMVEETKDEDGNVIAVKEYWEANADKQLSILNEWLARHERSESTGQRTPRGEGEKTGNLGVDKDGYGYAKVKVKGRKNVEEMTAIVKVLLSKKDEDPLAVARAEGIRFALGEIARLPGVSKDEVEEFASKLRKKASKADEE